MKPNYELLEHTADIRIRVKAKDQKELFKNAALAMFDIIAEPNDKLIHAPDIIATIIQEAGDIQELFVNWLNELLSLSSAKELIFADFDIQKIDAQNIRASATGISSKHYQVNTEIKAATYHELKVEKMASGWQAEIIFDV
jgi:SHS2 domain-containing protein